MKRSSNNGFTLSEVLIALTIIGVIAAITIPSIFASTRRLEVETKLKQTYSILNNALTLAVKDNGPVYTWDEVGSVTESSQSTSFFNTYLAPYLYLAKKNDKYKASDFGYYEIKRPNGAVYSSADNSGTRAVLNNGTVISLFASSKFNNTDVRGNVIYFIDVNGPKKPNVIGKDIFAFQLFYGSENPNPKFEMRGNTKYQMYLSTKKVIYSPRDKSEIVSDCKDTGEYCGALIQCNGWKIPKDYPFGI